MLFKKGKFCFKVQLANKNTTQAKRIYRVTHRIHANIHIFLLKLRSPWIYSTFWSLKILSIPTNILKHILNCLDFYIRITFKYLPVEIQISVFFNWKLTLLTENCWRDDLLKFKMLTKLLKLHFILWTRLRLSGWRLSYLQYDFSMN